MTIVELGEEYNRQAIILERKVNQLKNQLKKSKGVEWKKIKIRLQHYEKMYDECRNTANELQNYYGKPLMSDESKCEAA